MNRFFQAKKQGEWSCRMASKVEHTAAGIKKLVAFLDPKIICQKKGSKHMISESKRNKNPHQNCVYHRILWCWGSKNKYWIGRTKDQEETGSRRAGEVRNYSCWSISEATIRVFPKIGVPQNGWEKWKTLSKWMIWGYQYFRKHP